MGDSSKTIHLGIDGLIKASGGKRQGAAGSGASDSAATSASAGKSGKKGYGRYGRAAKTVSHQTMPARHSTGKKKTSAPRRSLGGPTPRPGGKRP